MNNATLILSNGSSMVGFGDLDADGNCRVIVNDRVEIMSESASLEFAESLTEAGYKEM